MKPRRWRIVMPLAVGVFAAAGPVVVPEAADAAPPQQCNPPSAQVATATSWAQKRLAYQRVWPLTEGAGVTVGVVDTGVDARHPILAGQVEPGIDVVNGGGDATTDCDGHGTLVAGIIAARAVPGVGFTGVAPQARILPVREANGNGDGTIGALAAGITAAVDAGARVVNVSVVVTQPNDLLEQAVRHAADRDVLIVAAAGNDAQNGNPHEYPAAYPGVVSVGAVGPDDKPTTFSEFDADVAVVAPGTDLVGPGAGGSGLVGGAQGTSFAAPYVAGVAALVRAYRPSLTAAQVMHRIEATADHPPGPLPDRQLGWGVVNPYRAVTAFLPEEVQPAAVPGPQSVPVGTGPVAHRPLATGGTLAVAGALLATTVLLVLIGVAVPAGRRRGWRPAGRGTGAGPT